MSGILPQKSPVVGVICEFNPFHNGHAYLLSQARALAGENGCIICVMSGCSTQRGECAVAEPYVRAGMALHGGADLVIELPFPWSSGSAEVFARAGVHILAEVGAEHLLFGSECGDIALLARAADLLSSKDFSTSYTKLCKEGMGTAAAYVETLRGLANDADISFPEGFPASNDLLGIAYLAAIRASSCPMLPHTIMRQGQDYRDEILKNSSFPSATALRRLISEAACDPEGLEVILEGAMPTESLRLLLQEITEERAPILLDKIHAYAHLFFRMADSAAFCTAELQGGLHSHLCKCARMSQTPQDFLRSAETKQYTKARLRRGMLFAVTGVTEEDLKALPCYTRVLGANATGRAYLAALKKAMSSDGLAVITKPAHAPMGRQRYLNEKMDSLFSLCMPQPKEAGWLMKKGPVMQME